MWRPEDLQEIYKAIVNDRLDEMPESMVFRVKRNMDESQNVFFAALVERSIQMRIKSNKVVEGVLRDINRSIEQGFEGLSGAVDNLKNKIGRD